MVYNATFKKIVHLYRGGQFYWWRNPEYVEKITNLSQVTDKHNAVSSTPCHERDSNSQLYINFYVDQHDRKKLKQAKF